MTLNPPLLTSSAPTAIAPASVTIGHVQLRDLVVCPRERGVVNYIQRRSIIEHDIRSSALPPRVLADLTFTPNSIASLGIRDSDHTLLAAGGPEAEIHLSLQSPEHPHTDEQERTNRGAVWQFETVLPGSINNSVLLTSMSLTRAHQSSVDPRIVISNNDCTVKFYDIPIRGEQHPKAIKESGTLRLDVAVNHSSLSPDGCTLLSVGDSPRVYLHRLTGGGRISFTPITTLTLPPPCSLPSSLASACSPASFSTAFSSNGSKFAVASQDGAVVVWDVRSSNPLKVFHTDKTRTSGGKTGSGEGNGNASGWLNDDFLDWSRGGSRAPGWGVRSVKFGSGGERGYAGREIMTFTEHTSLIHVIDARTFETEEIVSMPSCFGHVRRPLRPRCSRSPRPVTVSNRPQVLRPTPPPIVLALQETFRITATDPTSAPSSSTSRPSPAVINWRRRRSRSRDPEDDLVVIPPLGDRTVEGDLQRLLELHGLHARRRDEVMDEDSGANGNGRSDEDMEVDELELDCVSSHTPSRSSSPSPSAHIPAQASPARLSPLPVVNPNLARVSSPLTRRRTLTQGDFRGRLTGSIEEEDAVDLETDAEVAVVTNTDLDLAGTCFDPSGAHVYVASVDGVAEWSVSGSEKRWWADSAWV